MVTTAQALLYKFKSVVVSCFNGLPTVDKL